MLICDTVTGEAVYHTWTVCLSVIDARIVQVYCQYQLAVSVKAVLREICIKKYSVLFAPIMISNMLLNVTN